MTHEILSACPSSSAAGHLGVAETAEKKTKILLARTTRRHKTVCQQLSGMSKAFVTAQEIPSLIDRMAS